MSLTPFEILGIVNLVGLVLVLRKLNNVNKDYTHAMQSHERLTDALTEYAIKSEFTNSANDKIMTGLLDSLNATNERVIDLETIIMADKEEAKEENVTD